MSDFEAAVFEDTTVANPKERQGFEESVSVSETSDSPDESNAVSESPSVSANHIVMALEAMTGAGMANYAPLRFRYLQAMAKRVCHNRKQTSQALLQKLGDSLADYQREFIQAHRRATEQLETIRQEFPESTQLAEQYFNRYQFSSLVKLLATRQRNAERSSGSLAEVTNTLLQGLSGADAATSLEDSLMQQEQETVSAVLAQAGVKAGAPAVKLGAMELSSVRRFRQSCVKVHSHKVVNKALGDRPENPGPLNPQMLTIRSLSLLRDLSPEYLKRFVSYIDTMLWLEQSGAKTEPSKKSKTNK